MKKKFMCRDRALAIALLVIAGFFAYQSSQLQVTNLTHDPGPRVFPYIGCAILALCGIYLFIKPGPNGRKMNLSKDEWKRLIIMLVLYLCIVAGSIVFGIVYTLPVMLFIISYLFSKSSVPDMPKKKRILTTLLYTVLVYAAIYVIYVVLLEVRIRPGLIKF